MFGYLRPYKGELRLNDIRKYSAYYCALCNQIKKDYGVLWTYFLNYESVYILLFLVSITKQTSEIMLLRCHMNPFMKKTIQINGSLLSYVAFVNMALLEMKFDDDTYDEKKLLPRILAKMLQRKEKYRNMCAWHEELLEKLKVQSDILRTCENGNNTLDSCSNTTGNMLAEIIKYGLRNILTSDISDIETESILRLQCHIGKLIYTIDAYEDFQKDLKNNQFNPILYMNSEGSFTMALEKTKKIIQLLQCCISHEIKEIGLNVNKEILENILIFGIEHTIYAVEEKTCIQNRQ